jgi:hypothetical protein
VQSRIECEGKSVFALTAITSIHGERVHAEKIETLIIQLIYTKCQHGNFLHHNHHHHLDEIASTFALFFDLDSQMSFFSRRARLDEAVLIISSRDN